MPNSPSTLSTNKPYSPCIWRAGLSWTTAGAISEVASVYLKKNVSDITSNESAQTSIIYIANLVAAPLLAGFLVYWFNLYFQKKGTTVAHHTVLDSQADDHRYQLAAYVLLLEVARLVKSKLLDLVAINDKSGNKSNTSPLHDMIYFIECPGVLMMGFGLIAGMSTLYHYREHEHADKSAHKQAIIFCAAMLLGASLGIKYHSTEASYLAPFAVATPLVLVLWKLFNSEPRSTQQQDARPITQPANG